MVFFSWISLFHKNLAYHSFIIYNVNISSDGLLYLITCYVVTYCNIIVQTKYQNLNALPSISRFEIFQLKNQNRSLGWRLDAAGVSGTCSGMFSILTILPCDWPVIFLIIHFKFSSSSHYGAFLSLLVPSSELENIF